MGLRWQAICVDCADPGPLGRWWAELLGWRLTYEERRRGGARAARRAARRTGCRPTCCSCKVPEPKRDKVRLHIDLRPEDQAAEVARAEAMGATRVDIGQGEPTWVVLADPEGNEFCILRALTPEELAGSRGAGDHRWGRGRAARSRGSGHPRGAAPAGGPR